MVANRDNALTHDAWERWEWIWSLVFCGTLVVPLVLLALEGVLSPTHWPRALGLAAALLLLHAAAVWGLPALGSHLRAHIGVGVAYVAGLGVLTFLLIELHPAFSFLLGGFFSQLFFTLPTRWAIPAATSVTVVLGVLSLQNRSFPGLLAEPAFWLWVLGGLCGSLVSFWLSAIINQSSERKDLIATLQRTRRDLAQVEREAGVLEERQRLAREIHDTLAQGLISIITHLEAAEGILEKERSAADDAALVHHMQQARGTARANLGEARRVVRDLRPQVLEGTTLAGAAGRVVAAWSESTGIAAKMQITGEARALAPETEVTLLRVVQEALANVAKHADAHGVSVTLSYLPDRVVLDVQDDGVGLRAAAPISPFSAGFGLPSMRERVDALGGSLLLESEPGEGVVLVAEIPYRFEPSRHLSPVGGVG